MTKDSLQAIGISTGTDKATFGYLGVYEKYLEKYKDSKQLNVLELGILGGKSLKMWRRYFPHGRIMGADIQQGGRNIRGLPVDSSFFNTDSNSRFYLCDQSKEDDLQAMGESIVKETGRGIDVFIDDASHFQPDMMLTLGVLFPYLEKGGTFIMEDICTHEHLALGGRGKNIAEWWGSDREAADDPRAHLDRSAEKTILKYKESGKMISPYLSTDMMEYLNHNIATCDLYKAKTPPLTITALSSLAIFTKKA